MEYMQALLSTCFAIAGQATRYVDEEILPELGRLGPERDVVRARLGELESKKAAALQRGDSDVGWIESEMRELKTRLRELNSGIGTLTSQKGELQRYIDSTLRV